LLKCDPTLPSTSNFIWLQLDFSTDFTLIGSVFAPRYL